MKSFSFIPTVRLAWICASSLMESTILAVEVQVSSLDGNVSTFSGEEPSGRKVSRVLKKVKKSAAPKTPSKKSNKKGYTETPGYHQTGNYMVFQSYADTLCSEGQLKEIHGYALGVCQPYTTSGLWWINFAGIAEYFVNPLIPE